MATGNAVLPLSFFGHCMVLERIRPCRDVLGATYPVTGMTFISGRGAFAESREFQTVHGARQSDIVNDELDVCTIFK